MGPEYLSAIVGMMEDKFTSKLNYRMVYLITIQKNRHENVFNTPRYVTLYKITCQCKTIEVESNKKQTILFRQLKKLDRIF